MLPVYDLTHLYGSIQSADLLQQQPLWLISTYRIVGFRIWHSLNLKLFRYHDKMYHMIFSKVWKLLCGSCCMSTLNYFSRKNTTDWITVPPRAIIAVNCEIKLVRSDVIQIPAASASENLQRIKYVLKALMVKAACKNGTKCCFLPS